MQLLFSFSSPDISVSVAYQIKNKALSLQQDGPRYAKLKHRSERKGAAVYIREQEAHDQAVDKLSVKEYEDPFSINKSK